MCVNMTMRALAYMISLYKFEPLYCLPLGKVWIEVRLNLGLDFANKQKTEFKSNETRMFLSVLAKINFPKCFILTS